MAARKTLEAKSGHSLPYTQEVDDTNHDVPVKKTEMFVQTIFYLGNDMLHTHRHTQGRTADVSFDGNLVGSIPTKCFNISSSIICLGN